ncbi:MAG: nitroreductase family protein [Gammaproteobacteria bacterium]|nr:nitroreductase family protein [Gammaproteobacteria bacterium]
MSAQMHIQIVDEILSTARSVRRRIDFDKVIDRSVLLDCIDVAVQAPTGLAGENWRFVVVDEPNRKAQVAKIYQDVLMTLLDERKVPLKPTHKALIERLHEIPAMIFVCVEGEPPTENLAAQVAYFGSILPAAWSLMLALRARDIGTTWTTLLSGRQREIADILLMPTNNVIQTVMLPVGYTLGAVMRRAERLSAEQVTFWNSWGGQS